MRYLPTPTDIFQIIIIIIIRYPYSLRIYIYLYAFSLVYRKSENRNEVMPKLRAIKHPKILTQRY